LKTEYNTFQIKRLFEEVNLDTILLTPNSLEFDKNINTRRKVINIELMVL
jgi:hypothetical protein